MNLRIASLLLLTLLVACMSGRAQPTATVTNTRVHTHNRAQQEPERFATLHDAQGTPFQVLLSGLCETRPEETEDTLVIPLTIPIAERYFGIAHFIRIFGTQGQTLALGFFTPRSTLNTCYVRLTLNKHVSRVQIGFVGQLRR